MEDSFLQSGVRFLGLSKFGTLQLRHTRAMVPQNKNSIANRVIRPFERSNFPGGGRLDV
jgi:hypothetical protein